MTPSPESCSTCGATIEIVDDFCDFACAMTHEADKAEALASKTEEIENG